MNTQELKDFILLANAGIALVVTVASALATWMLLRWRVARVEKVVFGNGEPSLISRVDHIEQWQAEQKALCRERHERASA